MSNELVYGDASKFVGKLQAADAQSRQFFSEVVNYLSECAKNLSIYRESIADERMVAVAKYAASTQGVALTDILPAHVWEIKVGTRGDEVDTFKISTKFASLTLLYGHPPGSVRFLLEERMVLNSPFHPHGVEGYLLFSAEQKSQKSSIETASEQKPGEAREKKQPAPAIVASDGFLPPAFKTDSAAAFAEPLFWQLFQPLPVEPAAKKSEEKL